MKFNTVATSFGCNAEGVVCENDSIVLSGLPQLEAVSKYGHPLMAIYILPINHNFQAGYTIIVKWMR